ncbi:hypothetical protein GCM10022198_08660 [Klugiella xanthotipulae]|uniref:Antirestriction protein ArdA n=1 Tax=Klugiella xanthotipulae TaxID=244735 RepID=A0A543I422_9MICO|nr:hypothetical protein [Klugiella xanthotipulae]TQM65220.1 hypothetical protein FB466_0010 [Klugiella xanthotipulae]
MNERDPTPPNTPPEQPTATPPLTQSAKHAAEATERAPGRLESDFDSAFTVFRSYCWNKESTIDIEDAFHAAYWGDFPDRKAFLDSYLDTLDWEPSIAHTMNRLGIPDEALHWDYIALYHRATENFEFYDANGVVHVFLK